MFIVERANGDELRTCGELVDEREGLIGRHIDDCIEDRGDDAERKKEQEQEQEQEVEIEWRVCRKLTRG